MSTEPAPIALSTLINIPGYDILEYGNNTWWLVPTQKMRGHRRDVGMQVLVDKRDFTLSPSPREGFLVRFVDRRTFTSKHFEVFTVSPPYVLENSKLIFNHDPKVNDQRAVDFKDNFEQKLAALIRFYMDVPTDARF